MSALQPGARVALADGSRKGLTGTIDFLIGDSDAHVTTVWFPKYAINGTEGVAVIDSRRVPLSQLIALDGTPRLRLATLDGQPVKDADACLFEASTLMMVQALAGELDLDDHRVLDSMAVLSHRLREIALSAEATGPQGVA